MQIEDGLCNVRFRTNAENGNVADLLAEFFFREGRGSGLDIESCLFKDCSGDSTNIFEQQRLQGASGKFQGTSNVKDCCGDDNCASYLRRHLASH